MRKTLIALLIASVLPGLALAACPGGQNAEGCGMSNGRGMRVLQLTQEQRQQMMQIRQESMVERQKIHQKYWSKLPEADRKTMQEELKASRDKSDERVRSMLNPEQQKKFDELIKQRPNKAWLSPGA